MEIRGLEINKWIKLFLLKLTFTFIGAFLTLSVCNLLAWFAFGWVKKEVLMFIVISLILSSIAAVLGAIIPSKYKIIYVSIPTILVILCWGRAIVY